MHRGGVICRIDHIILRQQTELVLVRLSCSRRVVLVLKVFNLSVLSIGFAVTPGTPMLASAWAEAYRSGRLARGSRDCTAAGCSPRGCVAGAVRPGHGSLRSRPRGVMVVNPRRYRCPAGAIATGAAMGFSAGAAAVSMAGAPPKSGRSLPHGAQYLARFSARSALS
jgi:hypothetical protein